MNNNIAENFEEEINNISDYLKIVAKDLQEKSHSLNLIYNTMQLNYGPNGRTQENIILKTDTAIEALMKILVFYEGLLGGKVSDRPVWCNKD
jgi:hypothetical protein